MKITEKQYEQIKNYIFDCIDFEDYDFEKTNDKKELLSNLIETFKNEYWHEYNKQYYKYNTINGFVSWLQGLPSSFNVDFENHKILEIAKNWNFDISTEKKENEFLNNWFKMIAKSVFYLQSK